MPGIFQNLIGRNALKAIVATILIYAGWLTIYCPCNPSKQGMGLLCCHLTLFFVLLAVAASLILVENSFHLTSICSADKMLPPFF
jgi:hypothetical protein